MTFFSPEFVLAFLAFLIVYWTLKNHIFAQKILILLASYGFMCSVNPRFALVLAAYSTFVYFAGACIARANRVVAKAIPPAKQSSHKKKLSRKAAAKQMGATKQAGIAKQVQKAGLAKQIPLPTAKARAVMLAAVAGGLFFLAFFKYYGYVREFFNAALAALHLGAVDSVAFPLGISYYVFMSITYFVSVYRRECGEQGFLSLACFLAFFPSVVMGPIGRASTAKGVEPVLPQFDRFKHFGNADEIYVLIIFALVKMLLISGYLGAYYSDVISGVYGDEPESSAAQILAALLLYGVVLYTNFSGFIDMARALGLAMGFKLPQNFNMPYAAKNLGEFWDRWHISLSTFIRDYIYIPLGGSRNGFARTCVNLLIAFALSGIWHGAGLNFLIWGLLHGVALVFLKCLAKVGVKPLNPHLALFCTYIFVSFAWIFFANSLPDAAAILGAFTRARAFGDIGELAALAGILAGIFIYPKISALKDTLIALFAELPFLPKALALGVIFTLIFALMPSGIPNFIYAGF